MMDVETVTVDVIKTPFGFGVECSECGIVSGEGAHVYVNASGIEYPTWHARHGASETMQRHMCPRLA
jgi:hypothetical protein